MPRPLAGTLVRRLLARLSGRAPPPPRRPSRLNKGSPLCAPGRKRTHTHACSLLRALRQRRSRSAGAARSEQNYNAGPVSGRSTWPGTTKRSILSCGVARRQAAGVFAADAVAPRKGARRFTPGRCRRRSSHPGAVVVDDVVVSRSAVEEALAVSSGARVWHRSGRRGGHWLEAARESRNQEVPELVGGPFQQERRRPSVQQPHDDDDEDRVAVPGIHTRRGWTHRRSPPQPGRFGHQQMLTCQARHAPELVSGLGVVGPQRRWAVGSPLRRPTEKRSVARSPFSTPSVPSMASGPPRRACGDFSLSRIALGRERMAQHAPQ